MGCTASSSARGKGPIQKLDVKTIAVSPVPAESNSNDEDNASSITGILIQTLSSGLEFSEVVKDDINIFSMIKRGDLAGVTEIINLHSVFPPRIPLNRQVGMWSSSPLIVALQYGYGDIARLLLLQKDLGDLNMRNEKGATALLFACMEGLADVVALLIEQGASVEDVPTTEPVYNPLTDRSLVCSPLSIAVTNGRQTVVAKLLSAAGGNRANEPFAFPVVTSIRKSDKVASARGAWASEVTPLALACACGQLGVVRELLWRKCVPSNNETDSDGSTALHHLCRARQEEATEEIFLEFKRRELLSDELLQAVDCVGDTALHVATDCKKEILVRLLLEEGSYAASRNAGESGVTPLHIAIRRKSFELVTLLLEYGADPLLEDKKGVSAWDLAQKLRPESEICVAVGKAAAAWQGIRGCGSHKQQAQSTADIAANAEQVLPIVDAVARPHVLPLDSKPALGSLCSAVTDAVMSKDRTPICCAPDSETDQVTDFSFLQSSFEGGAEEEAEEEGESLLVSFVAKHSDDWATDGPQPLPLPSPLQLSTQASQPSSPEVAVLPASPVVVHRPVPPKTSKPPTTGSSFKRGGSAQLARRTSEKTTILDPVCQASTNEDGGATSAKSRNFSSPSKSQKRFQGRIYDGADCATPSKMRLIAAATPPSKVKRGSAATSRSSSKNESSQDPSPLLRRKVNAVSSSVRR